MAANPRESERGGGTPIYFLQLPLGQEDSEESFPSHTPRLLLPRPPPTPNTYPFPREKGTGKVWNQDRGTETKVPATTSVAWRISLLELSDRNW